ncbi:peptide ABC transporter substrate-binding protein [Spirillospora sp. CA-294931]|uniref:peptide ABC transporter substrate-binding protein n=1 Tax=Spirillospora sp. CA-294931 TaxID=3240042 RepID=UPI003D947722
MKSATRTAALVTGGVVMLVAPVVAMRAWSDPADPRISVGAPAPASLVPGAVRDASGRMIAGAVWTGLVTHDPATGATSNAAAESVTSQDRRTWMIKLREGGRFHDGSPVTAASFAGAWTAALRESWPGARLFTDVARVKGAKAGRDGMAGVTVRSDLTLEVTLDRPLNGFPALLGDPAFLPLPESVLRSRDWRAFDRRPIGNGPLRVISRDARETVLERPGGRTVVVKAMPDAAAQYRAVESGDLDLATSVPPNRHGAMESDFPGRHLTVPGRSMTYLAFPSWEKRLAGPSLRQALSMALDRRAVTEGPLGHQATPANALVPPGVLPGHREGQCRLCVHDPRAASAALTDAGGLAGPLTLWHVRGAGDDAWVKAVAEQLRKGLRLDVRPKAVTAAELEKALADRKVDGPFVLHSQVPYPAQVAALAPILAAGTGFEDGYTSDLVTRSEETAVPDEAVTSARLAETALLRDMPAMPLWSAHDHLVWSERLRGVASDAFAGPRLDRLTLKT